MDSNIDIEVKTRDDEGGEAVQGENSGPDKVDIWKSAALERFNLPDSYRVVIESPIPDLDNTNSRAFEVEDASHKTEAYATVLPNDVPIRFDSIKKLKEFYNSNFCNLIDEGFVSLNTSEFGNYAIIFEKPKGRSIASYMLDFQKEEERKAKEQASETAKVKESFMTEDFLARNIIEPLNEVLRGFSERGLGHGAINQDSIFVDSITNAEAKLCLKEGVSEISGLSQYHQYETIPRAMCNPLGKGEGRIEDDYFALGVFVYYMMFGKLPGEGESTVELLAKRMEGGTYNTYLKNLNIPVRMADILRGLLNDDPEERWGYDQIQDWARGKRFNLIRPNVKKESLRSYVYNKVGYSSKRSLSYAFYMDWDEAAAEMRTGKLVKWLELSVAQPNLADEVKVLINSTGGENSKSRKDNDELVTKGLILLDPFAPIRYRDIATSIDALGIILVNGWKHQNHSEIQTITEILKNNLSEFKAVRDPFVSEYYDRWVMQKVHGFITMNAYGFGIERCIYDLNPTLPCQSNLMSNNFIIDIKQLLYFLNDNSENLKNYDPMDKHIAAFLASKLGLTQEVKVNFKYKVNNMKATTQLTKMAIFSYAQKRTNIVRLNGLCDWLVDGMEEIFTLIKSKKNRKEFQKEISRVAKSGSISAVLESIISSGMIDRDIDELAVARNEYSLLTNEINRIAQAKRLAMRNNSYFYAGLFIAKVIAIIAFVTILVGVIL